LVPDVGLLGHFACGLHVDLVLSQRPRHLDVGLLHLHSGVHQELLDRLQGTNLVRPVLVPDVPLDCLRERGVPAEALAHAHGMYFPLVACRLAWRARSALVSVPGASSASGSTGAWTPWRSSSTLGPE